MTREIERSAVDAAHQAHVQSLFKTLVGNLIGMSEDDAVERFTRGLALGRRAHTLALESLDDVEVA